MSRIDGIEESNNNVILLAWCIIIQKGRGTGIRSVI